MVTVFMPRPYAALVSALNKFQITISLSEVFCAKVNSSQPLL